MVRGLDYYTRTAFEIVHEELGRSKAVGGGGRYDTLLKELGGPDVGGMGFAIGLERLSMGISNDDPRFAQSVDAYVAPLGDDAEKKAFTIVNRLREAGLIAEIRFGSKSLKSHMKQADRLGARTVLMLGEDELQRNEITVRDMQAGKQTSVKLENLIGFLSTALNPGKPHLSENETAKKTTVKSKAEKKFKGHRRDGRGKA